MQNLSSKVGLNIDLNLLGAICDLMIMTLDLEQRFAAVVQGMKNESASNLTRLERSITSSTSRRFIEDSTMPMASFLLEMGKSIYGHLNQTEPSKLVS